MIKLNNLNVKYKLLIINAIAVSGFLVLGIYSYLNVNKIEVIGAKYDHIIEQKDLLADILPPPAYLVETYLVTLRLAVSSDPAETDAMVAKLGQLKKDYEDRQDYWKKPLQDERELGQLLLEKSSAPAREYFEILDRDFIPAVRAGNKPKALELANGALKQKYEQHRAAVDELVTATNKKSSEGSAEV